MILLNCLFKGVKIRDEDDVFWQSIPQDDGHRKEGKLIVICSSMNLPVGKRVHVTSDFHEMLEILW